MEFPDPRLPASAHTRQPEAEENQCLDLLAWLTQELQDERASLGSLLSSSSRPLYCRFLMIPDCSSPVPFSNRHDALIQDLTAKFRFTGGVLTSPGAGFPVCSESDIKPIFLELGAPNWPQLMLGRQAVGPTESGSRLTEPTEDTSGSPDALQGQDGSLRSQYRGSVNIEDNLSVRSGNSVDKPSLLVESEANAGVQVAEVRSPKRQIIKLRTSANLGYGGPDRRMQLRTFVKSFKFEVVFACLILANAMVLAFEGEYAGMELGFQIGYAAWLQALSGTLARRGHTHERSLVVAR
ncbi:unnamed protein product [Polarella glacialis]|uniref:Uncharacterized protein n=1 Tax=Polarella glacialis TaxID=89957 RepID=A0A813L475_POLGL|nr:unnamed protein product [Polarella glacialis]